MEHLQLSGTTVPATTFMLHESIAGTPTGTILITGHSLGAAVATLAMYMLYPGGKNGKLLSWAVFEKIGNCQRKIDYLKSLYQKPCEHTDFHIPCLSTFYVRVQEGHFAYMNTIAILHLCINLSNLKAPWISSFPSCSSFHPQAASWV